jgi:hypothetical protein
VVIDWFAAAWKLRHPAAVSIAVAGIQPKGGRNVQTYSQLDIFPNSEAD